MRERRRRSLSRVGVVICGGRTPWCRVVVGWEEEADELFFYGEMLVSIEKQRVEKQAWGWRSVVMLWGNLDLERWGLTINPSYSPTVLLPDECYAHDDHYYSVHDCSDDGRSPDGLLIWLRRHGWVGTEHFRVLYRTSVWMTRRFQAQR